MKPEIAIFRSVKPEDYYNKDKVDIILGKVYSVLINEEDGDRYVIDEVGAKNYGCCHNGIYHYEIYTLTEMN